MKDLLKDRLQWLVVEEVDARSSREQTGRLIDPGKTLQLYSSPAVANPEAWRSVCGDTAWREATTYSRRTLHSSAPVVWTGHTVWVINIFQVFKFSEIVGLSVIFRITSSIITDRIRVKKKIKPEQNRLIVYDKASWSTYYLETYAMNISNWCQHNSPTPNFWDRSIFIDSETKTCSRPAVLNHLEAC